MTEPHTEAGKRLRDDPGIELDGYGYVLPEDWTERILAIEAEARSEGLGALREAVEAFLPEAEQYAPWDEDNHGCRYCGTFIRSTVPHRKGCKLVALRAALSQHKEPNRE